MDEALKFVAIEMVLSFEQADELEDHLDMNGYDFYLLQAPYSDEYTLLVWEEQANDALTCVKDRGINHRVREY